jgi:PadR family transcriptional regulator, regulatory protein PadR
MEKDKDKTKKDKRRSAVPEFRKGSTDIVILRLLQEQPMYGFALNHELEQRSGGYFSLKQGTLYPALQRLEKRGWIESYWNEDADLDVPRRKFYQLTDAGHIALKNLLDEWRTFNEKLAELLELK